MKHKTFREFHNELSWSVRIQVLMAVGIIAGALIFDAWESDWALTMLFAITLVLGVESFALSFRHHPKTWRLIRWGLLLALMALLLTSYF